MSICILKKKAVIGNNCRRMIKLISFFFSHSSVDIFFLLFYVCVAYHFFFCSCNACSLFFFCFLRCIFFFLFCEDKC